MDTSLAGRARRLFEFLRGAQRLKSSPVRSVDVYQREGEVIWLSDVPEHPAITVLEEGGEGPLLAVERVVVADPPDPGDELGRWLTEPLDEPDQEPSLRESIVEPSDEDTPKTLELSDFPRMRARYSSWFARWESWAHQAQTDRPARDLYGRLHQIYIKSTESPEDFELIVGTGCLSWQPIKRHLLTCAVSVHFDDRTGVIEVRAVESSEPVRLELDMVDPGLITAPEKINEIQADVKAYEGPALDRAATGDFIRRLVHSLDPDGEYRDENEHSPAGRHAVAAFAPALILRRRTYQGLIEIFDTVLAQLDRTGEVPDGLIPLLDPDHVPSAPEAAGEGAIMDVDGEPFLPMPVNDKQLSVIRRVDVLAQTLVQGPPGTGKTHTAAALISHLLAQGKRVLVTAQTDRALREVREKLPEEIKPLAVAVVGTSREDMADLKLAVQEIAAAASDHDAEANSQVIRDHLATIDRLTRERAELHSRLLEAREREVRDREHQGYRGTLSAIAQRITAERDQYGWLDHAAGEAPLTSWEATEWLGFLLDEGLEADEAQARSQLIEVDRLPDPARFARLVADERVATEQAQRFARVVRHPAFVAVSRLEPGQRAEVRQRLRDLAAETEQLAGRREQWLADALRDVRCGRADPWRARAATIAGLVSTCDTSVGRVGPLVEVSVREGDLGGHVALATEVRRFLDGGGAIKTMADGAPKIGAFAHKTVKQAQPLFDAVRVDGVAPTSIPRLETFIAWAEATKALTALDRAWPENTVIPPEDTVQERLQWHVTELAQLHRVLALADRLSAEEQRLQWLKLPPPNWTELADVRWYAGLVDAVSAQEALAAARKPLVELETFVGETAQWTDAARCVAELLGAVRSRRHEEFAAAQGKLARMWQVRQQASRRDELASRLGDAAPELRREIEETRHESVWQSRIPGFAEAWRWAATRAWVTDLDAIDVNAVQSQISGIERSLRKEVEAVAASRAWDHAASPGRLSGTARADLTQYAQLVQRAGKNTGAYRHQRRAEIRKAMDRCRPSVPVWIMPIYRIAEQLRVRPDMFDVVVVDEASQAGTEAVFLQYLAKKIVVIGDDKQVSPSAVGVDQQELRDLARQYLADDRYRDSWQDPKRSLFDEAKMRYGGLITLTEHRRCVPEIIGFSNRIAYEPDGIRLIPVRQYGVDRLEPVKAVYLADGYERGVTHKSNPVEAEAIAEQIEKCVADPAYDGKTFGVISLLGPTQAKTIESLLLARIPREEWASRNLRCGDAADFQGSERDVMFLSMVAAPAPDKRMAALTQEQYVQRFNVAVSRAKDQVWVFHSVRPDELPNRECMRFQLLDYSYGVINRGREDVVCEVVPEDRRVEPFDSLFEQRVFNRIVDRGYTVIPQYPAQGYRIDLVIVGGHGRLAVECDGDQWHGPDAYDHDLARQRDLERCGWRFVRIPGSAFDVDPAAALAGLWQILSDEEIRPAGWTPVVVAEPEWPAEAGVLEIVSPDAYVEYSGIQPPVAEVSRNELIEGIAEIVAVEGPMLGERIHRVYIQSSGGRRVGSELARSLNSAVSLAVRRGVLLADDPLGQSGVRPITYRLPDQPPVRLRELGPRDLHDMPPRELAAVLSEVAETLGWADEEALFRAVLDRLGLKRLTANVRSHLADVAVLARGADNP
ncbi:AAA domain-containing protein [Amycolatopsis sp. cg5]|uniref:AAA domain-containing protein n=1 Tax=Amycolatopsis sp. cg5 TaxID=3238802 RepID=UPI0035259673